MPEKLRASTDRARAALRAFSRGRPGRRFRGRYRLRRSRGPRGLHPARLANLAGGAALVVASAFFGWLPVLGWGTAVLGMSLIAGEVLAVAVLMDRLEVGARRLLGPVGRFLARLPSALRFAVSFTLALATLGLAGALLLRTFGA